MNLVKMDGAGWSGVSVDGAGWSWVHGLIRPNKKSMRQFVVLIGP